MQGGLCCRPHQDEQDPAGRDCPPGEAEDHGREQPGDQAEAGPLQSGRQSHHHLRGKLLPGGVKQPELLVKCVFGRF